MINLVVCDGAGDERPTATSSLPLRSSLLGFRPHHHVLDLLGDVPDLLQDVLDFKMSFHNIFQVS